MSQIKKDPNDPDACDIPDAIIQHAKRYGFIKGVLSMYLHGQLTYREALEQIVTTMMEEMSKQGDMLVEAHQDLVYFRHREQKPTLSNARPTVRALPESSSIPS